MPHESVNRKTYEAQRIVSLYCCGAFQVAEIRILLRHRDAYWRRRILDIGCGAGRTTELLHTLDVEYTGIDYSANMISQCRSRFPGVTCLQVDARDMSRFEDGAFDFVVFSNNGLDSLTHEDRLRALREINRVLTPGGLFMFASHNRQYHNAVSHPGLDLSLDPCRLLRALVRFWRRSRNHRRNSRFQRFEDDYWILNDRAHLYSLLTYYTDLTTQASQLRGLGFEPLKAYGRDGLELPLDGEDRDSSWIYYVARKA